MAVADLTLKVGRGQFFAVLGPNAAGKTTLLRVLAGLLKPTSGAARVAGFDIQTDPLEARRRMAYVPDFPFLYDKLTPWEFFRFTGQIFQMSGARLEAAARELIPRFNLEEFARKPIDGLSHGTRQRVAIVASLLHDPEVFIIDEPMVGLDPQHAPRRQGCSQGAHPPRLHRLPFHPPTQRRGGNGRPGWHHAPGPPGGRGLARRTAPPGQRRRAALSNKSSST